MSTGEGKPPKIGRFELKMKGLTVHPCMHILLPMEIAVKAKLLEEAGKFISDLIKVGMAQSRKKTTEVIEEVTTAEVVSAPKLQPAIAPQPPGLALPTSEETTTELKRRLAKELYRAELDLANGLRIANRPCDCLSNKHTLMLEAAAEELISQDPGNSVYQEIIDWIPANRSKVTPEAIQGGQYAGEYPRMANEFKIFRKRVMGSVGLVSDPHLTTEQANKLVASANEEDVSTGTLTLEQAKKMAAEEAAKEVEQAWNTEA